MNRFTINHSGLLSIRSIIFMILVLVLALCCHPALAAEKVFRLAHDDYKPYHWHSKEKNQSIGIFIDICDEIIGKGLGYQMKYKEYPWSRAQYVVKEGTDDAFITIPTPERLTYIEVGTEPFVVMTKVPFTQVDNPNREKMSKMKLLKELSPYKLLDYRGNGWSKKQLVEKTGLTLEYSSKIESVLKKLAVKRGDIFIEDPNIIHYNLKLLGLSQKITALPVILDETEFMLCISKKSPIRKELSKINALLKKFKNDGTIEKILNRWK